MIRTKITTDFSCLFFNFFCPCDKIARFLLTVTVTFRLVDTLYIDSHGRELFFLGLDFFKHIFFCNFLKYSKSDVVDNESSSSDLGWGDGPFD